MTIIYLLTFILGDLLEILKEHLTSSHGLCFCFRIVLCSRYLFIDASFMHHLIDEQLEWIVIILIGKNYT